MVLRLRHWRPHSCRAGGPVALLLILCIPALSGAQEKPSPRTWDDLLRDLEVDRSIRVDLLDGTVRLGRSIAVDDSSLSLRVRSGSRITNLGRGEINRVRLRTGSGLGTGLLVGLLAGGAIGAGAVVISGECFSGCGELDLGVVFAFYGAAIGTAVGALVGSTQVSYEDYRTTPRE